MKRLLVVVDFQNDFVDGALGFAGADRLQAPIVSKIKEYRSCGDQVAFTLDVHSSGYLKTQEGKNLPVAHCLRDSVGVELYGEVNLLREENDEVFEKSSFGSPGLFEYLLAMQRAADEVGALAFKSIEFVGLVSNICLIVNVALAKTACPEVPVIVDASCTGSFDAALHGKALDVMESFQVSIANRTA